METDIEHYRTLVAERGAGTPSVADVRARIAKQRAATARTGLALLAVRRLREGDFIGYCGLIVGRATVDEPEIAYELHRSVHGNGYATEAAAAVIRAATDTGRACLWSTVRSWNVASLRVLDKLGFTRNRVVDDDGELIWLTRRLP